MLSFKSFKEEQKGISLLLENKLTDDYWLKVSYDDLLYLIKTNKLRNKRNILFVTKSSDHSSIYNDIYEFPVSIYFDKLKLYQLIIDKNYKSSIDKDNTDDKDNAEKLLDEEIETTNDHFDEIDPNDDSNFDISDNDLLNNSELNDSTDNDTSNIKEDDNKKEVSDKTIDELPSEISINEKEVDIDPKNNIKIIEIDLERIGHLLDKEVSNISKMLNISRTIKNKSYKESRDKVREKFKSMTSDFCSANNIVINFID